MHNVGNFHDAQTILQWVRNHPREYGRPKCVEEGSAPLGWTFLGTGSYRSVWRSPEGVAYKVGHSSEYNQCHEEIRNLKNAWSTEIPEGVRLPRFDSFEVNGELVPAMEVVEGMTLGTWDDEIGDPSLRSRYYELMCLCERRFHLWDMHADNCMIDLDGLLVPIDFGG